MVRFIALASFVGLSACVAPIPVPAPAPGTDPAAAPVPAPNPMSAKERFVSAVEANGCTMTASNLPTILDQATVGPNELESIIIALTMEGRAAPAGANIRVITDRCPA